MATGNTFGGITVDKATDCNGHAAVRLGVPALDATVVMTADEARGLAQAILYATHPDD